MGSCAFCVAGTMKCNRLSMFICCSNYFSSFKWNDSKQFLTGLQTQGCPSPWGNDAFPSISDSPISENLSDSVENFPTFSTTIFFYFHPQKFLMTFFLVIDSKFRIPPIFAVSVHSPLSEKIIICLYFLKFPPDLVKFTFFYILCVFHFPLVWPWCIYASHNARTGRPCSNIFISHCT